MLPNPELPDIPIISQRGEQAEGRCRAARYRRKRGMQGLMLTKLTALAMNRLKQDNKSLGAAI